jgi:hypothetical protein
MEGIKDNVEGQVARWDEGLPALNQQLDRISAERLALRRSAIRSGVSNVAGIANALFLQTGISRIGLPLEPIDGVCSSEIGK